MTQVFAYAEGLIIRRLQSSVKESLQRLHVEAGRLGLKINEEKTKLLILRRDKWIQQQHYMVGGYSFKMVHMFQYLIQTEWKREN